MAVPEYWILSNFLTEQFLHLPNQMEKVFQGHLWMLHRCLWCHSKSQHLFRSLKGVKVWYFGRAGDK